MKKSYMRRAITLAKRGSGYTSPNPLVGAVIVRDNRIIGEGYHTLYGRLHAERAALANCSEDPRGATLYVTLEPCCHHGKQPPCCDAIIEAGISTVIIGSRDPNPLVAGKGTAILRTHGITVIEDFMKEECDRLNPIFFHYITEKSPYVALKYAMSADGKIALATGESRWITGPKARRHVHKLRQAYGSILVGIETVLADNPMLTCRLDHTPLPPRQPVRIVLDSHLRIPLDSALVQSAKEVPLLIVCEAGCVPECSEKYQALLSAGAEILTVSIHPATGRLDVQQLLQELGHRGIDSLLVEGGGSVHASFLNQGLAHRLYLYLGAQILGGGGKSPVGSLPIASMADTVRLGTPTLHTWGKEDRDVLLEYELLAKEEQP